MLLLPGCGRLGFDLKSKSGDERPYAPGADSKDAGDPKRDASSASRDAGLAVHAEAGCDACSAGDASVDAGPAITADDVTFTRDTNLSFDNTLGRNCTEGGDMVSYSVLALTDTAATLDHLPDPGCLSPGDEVLLISMRGTPTDTSNAGRYELLRVAALSGAQVDFESVKQGSYGEGASDDAIGTGAGQHRVVLQRVPTYGNASIESRATLRSYSWDGTRGGVLAMRVQGRLRIDGRIALNGNGYAGGAPTLSVSTTGQQGESIDGDGNVGTSARQGAGGGGLGDGMGCRQSGSGGGGAGHAITGAAGSVPDCNATGGGAGGAEVGARARLLLGSGGGAGGTDNIRTDNPAGGAGGTGGGAVLLIANRVVGQGGVRVEGRNGQGDAPGVECNEASNLSCWDHSGPGGAGAGGTIRIEARSVDLDLVLSAAGGKGGNGNDTLAGNGGDAGGGRVVIAAPP